MDYKLINEILLFSQFNCDNFRKVSKKDYFLDQSEKCIEHNIESSEKMLSMYMDGDVIEK